MKTISFLKNVTLLEIILNTIMAIVFFGGILTQLFDISAFVLIGIGIFHITSMVLHWLAWNQLPTTHSHRLVFNCWVAGSFVLTFVASLISMEALMIMSVLLLAFAGFWFIFYCMVLFKEYAYLKRKKDLYEKRELIHF